MKAQSNVKPGRSRRMTILVVFLAGATILSIAGIHFLYGQWDKVFQEKQSANEQLIAVFRQTDAMHTSDMLEYMADRSDAFTDFAKMVETAKFFEDFSRNNAGNEILQTARARTFELKGQLYVEINEARHAEREFREAQRILENLMVMQPHPEFQLALSSVNNRLSYLFAGMGRIAEAHALLTKSIAQLDKHNDPAKAELELAIAYHNLAMLTQLNADDRTTESYLRKSAAIFQELAGKPPTAINPLKRLIDAQQYMTGILWRARRFEEAKAACCRSLDLIKLIENLPQFKIDLEFTTARALAQTNLNNIQTAIVADKVFSTNSKLAGWMWIPLTQRDGKTIRSGIYARGNLPAEFEKHEALLLSFPWDLREHEWAKHLNNVMSIAKAAHAHIRVIFLVPDNVAQEILVSKLKQAKIPTNSIHFLHLKTDTVWLRDFGPFAVTCDNYQCKLVDAAYSDVRTSDERAPAGLGRLLRMEVVRSLVRLTGGNLLSNGQGLCLATKRVLKLNVALGHSEEHVTKSIMRLFGARQVVYLDQLAGEPTGDIDWFAAFTGPNTIVVGDYEGSDDENTAILNRNAAILEKIVTPNGPLRVVRMPMPQRGDDFFGGTYTNVVFANKALLVPTWSDPATEKRALETYQRLLPGWSVIGIDMSATRRSEGAMRCMSAPLYRLSSWKK